MNDTPSSHPLVAAERVTGTRIFSADGVKLGKVKDLAIDKQSGTIVYAILGPDGLLDSHRRYRPIAWNLLRYDRERAGYVVSLSQSEIEAAADDFHESELGGWTQANKAMLI